MALSLVFDIVIAVICLVVIIRNAARGFIKSFVMLMKSVLAVFLAYIFNAPLARALSSGVFKELSHSWVRDLMLSTEKPGSGYALYEIFDGIPEWFTKVTISTGMDSETVEHYFVEENCASIEIVDEFTVLFGDALSMLISTIIAFIIIFIVLEIVLSCIGALLNKLGKLPVWKTVNVLLGAIIGVIISSVIAWLISMAIIYVFQFGANYYPEIFERKYIDDTVIVKFFEEHNLFNIVKSFVD